MIWNAASPGIYRRLDPHGMVSGPNRLLGTQQGPEVATVVVDANRRNIGGFEANLAEPQLECLNEKRRLVVTVSGFPSNRDCVAINSVGTASAEACARTIT